MKRNLSIICIFILILSFPILRVNAIQCNDKVLSIENKNFLCSGIDGDKLTFTFNNQDYSEYFTLRSDGKTIDIDSTISFPTDVEIATIEVKDSSSSTFIKIKNNNYITTTTTTTTTTQVAENIILVNFDKNDGSDLLQKKCAITDGNDYCSVVLPNMDVEGFNGWGTQSTCKEGIKGTVKVYQNTTYYACYIEDENEQDTIDLVLKYLNILNEKTLEEINYGQLDDSKNEYSFRVLYEVDSIIVKAVADNENVNVEVSGNDNLVVGENKVLITLSDENNNKKTITLNVERLEEGEALEKIHYLSSLVIGGSEINFDKEKFEYTITISSDIEQVQINKEAYYEDDIVTVIGNEDLINGSKIYIKVSGEDETSTIYTINVIKEESSNLLFIIIVGIISLLVLIIIIVIIVKSKKNNTNKEVKKNKEKIKKAKNKAKENKPDVLVNETKNEEIEVLKF